MVSLSLLQLEDFGFSLPSLASISSTICEIVRYSDAELDQCVKVQDPDNLPDDFIQRLRARANNVVLSHPIDLNHVSVRLGEISVDRGSSPRPSSSASITTKDSPDPEENYRQCLEEETRYYNRLIKDGGRPSHRISLGYDVAKNSTEYREILSYWHTSPSDPYNWMVFSIQLGRWQPFRKHQQSVREKGRFPAYCQRLHDRLRSHGFERSVQLDEEPDRQDKLTTWVEFLNYEYRKYDHTAGVIKLGQTRHEEAWKKLMDSKVLRPMETEESLWDSGIGFQLENEQAEALKTVESAASTATSAEKVLLKTQSTGVSTSLIRHLERELSVAACKLTATTNSFEQARIRRTLITDFHYRTKSYKIAKEDAASHRILLQWIRQQIPLIELELNPVKVIETDSGRSNSRREQSLKHNRANDCGKEPISKQQRKGGESHSVLDHGKCASARVRDRQLKRNLPASIGKASQDHNIPYPKTSNSANLSSSLQPLSTQSGEAQNSASTSRPERLSVYHSTPRSSILKFETKKSAKVVPSREEEVKKRGRRVVNQLPLILDTERYRVNHESIHLTLRLTIIHFLPAHPENRAWKESAGKPAGACILDTLREELKQVAVGQQGRHASDARRVAWQQVGAGHQQPAKSRKGHDSPKQRPQSPRRRDVVHQAVVADGANQGYAIVASVVAVSKYLGTNDAMLELDGVGNWLCLARIPESVDGNSVAGGG
ncbi:hypothetical protein G7Y89_g14972 [Cudoniella acicularis]|uniref:Uncharacterized protein n=1 Tax=Cudoniella acicularis TaxID=354080 RepID=A0A8H4QVT3_9HELO|nr:hypothetical protein G7Y89_g14972 [Cudoniella acicularis]